MSQHWVEIPVAVTPALGDGPLCVMWYTTQGYGNVLPHGANWVSENCWNRPATPELIAEKVATNWAKAARPAPEKWRVMSPTEAEVLKDRTYRNAFVDDGSSVKHDMGKAKELHRAHLRAERAERLGALDGQWMRAIGQGKKAEADAVEAERQVLRDAPADPRIDAAKTVDELKAVKL